MLHAGDILLDLKSGLRQLRRKPAVSAGSIIAVAFAIGISLTVFCAFRAVFLEPPPYPEPQRLVSIDKFDADHHPIVIRISDVDLLREHSRSFSALSSLGYAEVQRLSKHGGASSIYVQHVSADLFSLIDVKPLLGRVPNGRDAPGSALIARRTWQRLFSGDAVLGRTIFLHREGCRIVGILPEGFDVPSSGIDVWIASDTSFANRMQSVTGLIGRLKPRITAEDATRELETLIPLFAGGQDIDEGLHFEVRPLAGRDRPLYIPLFVLLILAAICILVLALVNVESSLMARANAREFEFALRNTLGAVRSRLFVQVVIESLVLAISGGLLGAVFGYVGVKAIMHLIPESVGLTRLQMTHFDLTAWSFAALTTVIMGLLLGVTPAVFASKIGSTRRLRSND